MYILTTFVGILRPECLFRGEFAHDSVTYYSAVVLVCQPFAAHTRSHIRAHTHTHAHTHGHAYGLRARARTQVTDTDVNQNAHYPI